jgi:hypothetical protein
MRAQFTAQGAIRFIGEGVVMVLITIFAPEGLVGLLRYLVAWWKGKEVQPRSDRVTETPKDETAAMSGPTISNDNAQNCS